MVAFGFVDVAGAVIQSLGEFVPGGFILDAISKFFDPFSGVFAEVFMAPVATGYADDGDFRGEPAIESHLIQGWDQFPVGKIARCSKDRQDLGFGDSFLAKSDAEGVFEQINHSGVRERGRGGEGETGEMIDL